MKTNKKLLRALGLFFIIAILTFLVPVTIGWIGKGFDSTDVILKNNMYISMGIAYLFIILIGLIYSVYDRKGDEKYGNSVFFSSVGEYPWQKMFKKFTIFQLTWLFVIITLILGLFTFFGLQQTSFMAFGELEHQFSPGAEIAYSVPLVAGAENAGFAAVLVMVSIGIGLLARRYKWSFSNFAWILVFSILLFGTLYWVGNHMLAYSGSDVSLAKVAFFGLVMCFITIFTGCFTPAYILHGVNNLFVKLKDFLTSDKIVIWFVVVIVVLVIGYYMTYKGRLTGRKVEG